MNRRSFFETLISAPVAVAAVKVGARPCGCFDCLEENWRDPRNPFQGPPGCNCQCHRPEYVVVKNAPQNHGRDLVYMDTGRTDKYGRREFA